MNEQAIVERIISDAEQEARNIISEAEARAGQTVAEASKKADRHRLGTEAEINEKVKGIVDGKAAAARLDAGKIALGEKRGVIDELYSRALEQLVRMSKAETLRLAYRLLAEYAEEGDEIVFAENFPYAQDVASLNIVKDKKLKVSPAHAPCDGGFILCGKNSDKNLSYAAILSEDREQYEAEIATKIFATEN